MLYVILTANNAQLDKEQWDLVCEALSERKSLLDSAPHLSAAIPIMIPVYSWYVYKSSELNNASSSFIPLSVSYTNC